MKNILRIKHVELSNGEHFQFHTEIISLFDGNTDTDGETFIVNKVQALFTEYKNLFANQDLAYKEIRKSALTEEIQLADKNRDMIFRGMVETNNALLCHFDTNMQNAAKRLKIVFDTYGNLAIKSYAAESAGITNLIQELNNNYPADIALTRINTWTTQLAAANNAFINLVKDRDDKTAEKCDFNLKECRYAVDNAYRKLIVRIEALVEIEGETNYAAFIKRLNVIIKRYRDMVAR